MKAILGAGAMAVAMAGMLAAAPARAAADGAADWPCQQRKVPSLTPAAVWSGPAIDPESLDWRADPEVAEFAARLSQRRLPMEEAEAEIAAFAEAQGDEAAARLTLLFAALFETMNAERGQILDGIERYARRQREMAKSVRTMAADLGTLRRSADADPQKVSEAQTALEWQTRIFNERRASLPYVCEVPRFVEQRLFALGRIIAGEIPE